MASACAEVGWEWVRWVAKQKLQNVGEDVTNSAKCYVDCSTTPQPLNKPCLLILPDRADSRLLRSQRLIVAADKSKPVDFEMPVDNDLLRDSLVSYFLLIIRPNLIFSTVSDGAY